MLIGLGRITHLPNVLFEVQGPGKSRRMRRVRTNEKGEFAIRSIPAGTYRFKTTLNGFQSAMGTIVVSKKGSAGSTIRIEMPFGI
jgi:hypothetical protein